MFVLVHPDLGRCFDVVEATFPVASPLTWVDISEYENQPEHGWTAQFIDGEWIFTNPNQEVIENG